MPPANPSGLNGQGWRADRVEAEVPAGKEAAATVSAVNTGAVAEEGTTAAAAGETTSVAVDV